MIPILDTLISLFDKGLDKVVPDANVRLQQATELAKLAHREFELEIQDRASARAREMAVKDQVPGMLAAGLTIGLFGGAFYFNLSPPPESAKTVVEMLMSAARDGWIMMIAYYFGSMNSKALK